MRALLQRFVADTSGSLLVTTIKGATLITIFSVGGAWYLSERLEAERRAMATLSAAASGQPSGKSGIDMTTTGSITKNGNSTRLDPCIVLKH